jgi:hypothetical protein
MTAQQTLAQREENDWKEPILWKNNVLPAQKRSR